MNDALVDDVDCILVVDALAVELYIARGNAPILGFYHIRDRLERCRLTGTIAPQQGDALPLADTERHALHRQDDFAVNHFDVVEFKHAHLRHCRAGHYARPALSPGIPLPY